MKQIRATKPSKQGPMPVTPVVQEQWDQNAKDQAEMNKCRPKFTQGGAAKGR